MSVNQVVLFIQIRRKQVMTGIHRFLSVCVCFLLAGIVLSACDQPSPTGIDYDIPNVQGLIIYKGRAEVFRVEDGEPFGELVVSMLSRADVYNVEFRDENDETLSIKDDEYRLDFVYGTGQHIIIERQPDLGKWHFQIQPQKAGETSMNLQLMNGNVEADYTSPKIPVKVVE
jgi:hypothetical protein